MIQLIHSFFLPFNGILLIFKPGVKKFALVPLLINTSLYIGIGWLAMSYFDEFTTRYLPQGGLWRFLDWIVWPLAVAAYVLVAFYSFTVIANLIGAPFNGLLAARVENHLTGKAPPEDEHSVLAATVPAIFGEVQKLTHFVLLAIPVLILFVVPGVNAIAPELWLLLGLWFLTLEYCDYPMGNHGIRPRKQRQMLAHRRLHSLAFGAGATVLMMTPVLQLAAMPATVAGATRFWVERFLDSNA